MEEKTNAGRQVAMGEASSSGGGGGGGDGGVQVFELTGPSWRPRLHPGSRSLGIPDMYSATSGSAEDDISESSVKNGFSVRPVVVNETFSAHDMIFDRLKARSLLPQLGSLFQEVVRRRDNLSSHLGTPAPLHFRPPQRVTLNEVKLAAYVKELADPNVPLKKLARSVPHGYRGERMLDMLWNGGNLTPAMVAIKAQASQAGQQHSLPRSVTIDRAVWFVRVVGSSEITSSRARQNNANSYTVEWTAVIMAWLRKQIVELNVVHPNAGTPTTPSSPAPNGRTAAYASVRASFAHHDGAYSLLLEDDFRLRWVSKWQYSVRLLCGLNLQHLIEPQLAVKTTLDLLRTANIVQVSFLLALFEELVEIIFTNASLVQLALDTLCNKVTELSSVLGEGRLSVSIEREMESMVKRIAVRRQESLVNPSRWMKHAELLKRLIDASLGKETSQIITRRNEKLLTLLLNERVDVGVHSVADEQLVDIAILDRLAVEADLQDTLTQFFRPGKQSSSEKLRTVLVWSTTRWRSGSHRPFAGAKMLHLFTLSRNSKPSRSGKTAMLINRIDMDTFLLKWISEVESAVQQGKAGSPDLEAVQSVDIQSLIVVVGELIRLGCFSYSKYLQRLTARGLTATNSREDKGDTAEFLHAKVMRSVPLLSASASLEHQRRVAIYGNRSKESWEEAMQRRAFKEVANAFSWSPSLFNSAAEGIEWNDDEPLRHFWSSSRFVQSRVIQAHILAYFRQAGHSRFLSASTFIHLTRFIAKAEDYVSLFEIILLILEDCKEGSESLLSAARDVALEHRMTWVAMDLALLERLNLSPFPFYETHQRSTAPQQANLEVVKRLQDSFRQYMQGNENQSSQTIGDAVGRFYLADSLAHAVLLAATGALAEGGEMDSVCRWAKLVPAAVGVAWDQAWQEALVDSLHKQEGQPEGGEKDLGLFVLHLIQRNLVSAADVLQHFLLPHLEQACLLKPRTLTGSMQLALLLIRGLLLASVEVEDACTEARLRSIRSTLVVSSTTKDIVALLSCLSSLEANLTAIVPLRQAICREPLIQAYFQPSLFDLAKIVRDRVRGEGLTSVLADLLPSRRSLLQSNPLELDYPDLIEEHHQWHSQQRLFELSILIQRLESMESGQQNRAQNKVLAIARLSANRWFSLSAIEQYGLPLLTESRSALFATTVVEETLQRIHTRFKVAEGVGVEPPVLDTIRCGLHLVQSQARVSLSAATVATSLLATINQWLDSALDDWQEDQEEQLGLRLATLCLFLRFDNGWNMQAKVIEPSLIAAIVRLAIRLSSQGVREAVVEAVMDVASYHLQEVPNDVLQAFQLHADSIAAFVRGEMPDDDVARRCLFLINRGHLLPPSRFVLAQSASSAFSSGQVVPVVEKPWDWHNNVEALDYYLDQKGQGQDETMTLANNGPISLDLFGAKRTGDRLPVSSVKIDSEVSYGLHWAGEPMYARDIRRGVLDLETDEEVKASGKSLARVAGSADKLASDNAMQGSAETPAATPSSAPTPAPVSTSGTPSKKRREREGTTGTSTPTQEGAALKKTKKKR